MRAHRKHFYRATGVTVASAIAFSLATTAADATPTSDDVAAQDALAEQIVDSVSTSAQDHVSDIMGGKARRALDERIPAVAAGAADAPSFDGKAGATISPDGLRVTVANARPQATDGSAAILGGVDGSTFVAQRFGDDEGTAPGLQIVNVATSPTEALDLAFGTDVPTGAKWTTLADGSLQLIDAEGAVLAVTEKPWAVDANGVSLPTSYSVDGSTIVQHVDTAGATFPVASDPSWWWVAGTTALCIAEIAGLALAGVKVVQAFTKAQAIIKASTALVTAYNRLGASMSKVLSLFKTYLKSKTSLTATQAAAVSTLMNKIGAFLFNALGLGSCYDLVTS